MSIGVVEESLDISSVRTVSAASQRCTGSQIVYAAASAASTVGKDDVRTQAGE